MALHDCIAKDVDRPLWRLASASIRRAPPLTSFTIGIATLEETLGKVRDVGAHPVIKVKLGTGAEIETIAAIRAIYAGTIRIDANEGWTPESGAVAILQRTRTLRASSFANSRSPRARRNGCAGSANARRFRS